MPVSVATHSACPTCRGTGAEPGTQPVVCPVCHGRGVESQGQGLFSITRPCERCGGSGTVIEKPCHTCHGQGRMRELKKYRVNIPAGVKDGSRIRLAGKGEAGLRGGPAGDLFVVTHVTESPVFQRKGEHFEVEVPITVAEALGGADVEVPTLAGTKKLRVPPGTKHGTVQRLRGEGPAVPGASGKGDLRYRFVIDVPGELSDEQRQRGRRALQGDERQPARADPARGEAGLMGVRRTRVTASVDARPRRLHDLRRRRAGGDAPADAADVRGARADRAEALAEGHAAVLALRRRAAAADPGADLATAA